uniref:Uncharacterized protein n=1 Tax=Bionectria ochroleuca TaxID=29856 RepID=A0A8H7TR74_BIOOC
MYFTKATGLAIALLAAGAKQALANPEVESTIDTSNMERSDAEELVSASHVLREEDSVYKRDFIGQFDEIELVTRGLLKGAIKGAGKPHRRGVISSALKAVGKPHRRGVISSTIKAVGKPHRRGVISSAHKAVKSAGKYR